MGCRLCKKRERRAQRTAARRALRHLPTDSNSSRQVGHNAACDGITLGAATTSVPFPWNKPSGLALMGLALTYLFAANHLSGTRNQLLWAGLAPTAAPALAVFFGLTLKPVGSQINPMPADAASITQSKALYVANCQPCHGAGGKGDGPVGLTLNPRPADLTAHATPGVHTDGQLFDWITHGYPGSLMPAFGQRLAERDRWDLVNFNRTLAPH